MYGGKLVKKATRGIKKVVKSPIGKAALLYSWCRSWYLAAKFIIFLV